MWQLAVSKDFSHLIRNLVQRCIQLIQCVKRQLLQLGRSVYYHCHRWTFFFSFALNWWSLSSATQTCVECWRDIDQCIDCIICSIVVASKGGNTNQRMVAIKRLLHSTQMCSCWLSNYLLRRFVSHSKKERKWIMPTCNILEGHLKYDDTIEFFVVVDNFDFICIDHYDNELLNKWKK